MAEVSRFPLLSRDEELALARAYHEHNDIAAAHQLVVSNLRFVVKVAHQYRGYGLRLLDLIQEGNIGLMTAVKKFDPSKGYRLISYAVWWIRDRIHSFLLRSWSLVKLGSGRVRRKLFFKLRSTRSQVEQEQSSEKDPRGLAQRLGVEESELSEMELRMAARDFSLDAEVTDGGGATHLDRMQAETTSPEQEVLGKEERRLLSEALASVGDKLNHKERYVLEERLLADEPLTLAQVGQQFGVSRERARQIESQVIAKLRVSLTAKPQLRELAAP